MGKTIITIRYKRRDDKSFYVNTSGGNQWTHIYQPETELRATEQGLINWYKQDESPNQIYKFYKVK